MRDIIESVFRSHHMSDLHLSYGIAEVDRPVVEFSERCGIARPLNSVEIALQIQFAELSEFDGWTEDTAYLALLTAVDERNVGVAFHRQLRAGSKKSFIRHIRVVSKRSRTPAVIGADAAATSSL